MTKGDKISVNWNIAWNKPDINGKFQKVIPANTFGYVVSRSYMPDDEVQVSIWFVDYGNITLTLDSGEFNVECL